MIQNIESGKLKKFLKLLADESDLDWILLGGALLPAMEASTRPTVDVDLVLKSEKMWNSTQQLKLMELAEKVNWSPEIVNSAAAFYLYKIANFSEHLILMLEGRKGKIWRPDVELFFKLKCARMSEADFLDCKEYFRFAKKNSESFDRKRLALIIESARSKSEKKLDKNLQHRYNKLIELINRK